jgi:hypothetical protein
MSQKVLIECEVCGWSAIISVADFEKRCPNGHNIEDMMPMTGI